MIGYLERKFDSKVSSIQECEKVDLDEINHLSGKLVKYLKLNFRTINDMNFAKNAIKAIVEKNALKSQELSISDLLQMQ